MEIIHDAVESQPQPVASFDPRSELIFNGYIETTRLIALAHPTDWSDSGIELATRALDAIRRTLTALAPASDLTSGDRLRRAFDTANADLLEHAQASHGYELDARIGVGAAVVLVEGYVATVGLVPPAQVLLWQDGRLTWCPTRESWTGQDAGLTGSPLGWAKEQGSTVVATSVNQRDELVITTDALARELARMPASELRSSTSLCDQIAQLGSDSAIDPGSAVAISTRFIAPTVSGSLLGSTRHALAQLEGRVKSAWTAIRTQQ